MFPRSVSRNLNTHAPSMAPTSHGRQGHRPETVACVREPNGHTHRVTLGLTLPPRDVSRDLNITHLAWHALTETDSDLNLHPQREPLMSQVYAVCVRLASVVQAVGGAVHIRLDET